MVPGINAKESGRKWGVPEWRGIMLSKLCFINTKIFSQQHEKKTLGQKDLRGSDVSSRERWQSVRLV